MKPMLASPVDFTLLKYPCYVSPKIDGIRCLIEGGLAMSRSLKPLPNRHLQELARDIPHGLDMEITVGEPTSANVMQATSSGVMSYEGEPNFQFHVLDRYDSQLPFNMRYADIVRITDIVSTLRPVHQHAVYDKKEIDMFLDKCLEKGYEGVMLRDGNAKYKYGRSTAREGALLKYKKFADDEAEVVGFQELMHNANPAFEGELGQTKRQTLQENMFGMNTLGALLVTSPKWPKAFSIGTGFDAATRQCIWDNRKTYLGKTVKYKYFETGVLEAPRFPVFLGWRSSLDRS